MYQLHAGNGDREDRDKVRESFAYYYPGYANMDQSTELVFLNACEVPTNRGLTYSDRAAWSPAKDPGQNGIECDGMDASLEETFHYISDIAARIYTDRWGVSFESTVGKLVKKLSGDCPHGF